MTGLSLLAFTFSSTAIKSLAAVALAALAGWGTIKAKERVVERRKRAIKVGNFLENLGLSYVADIVNDYSVGDISAAIKSVGKLRDLLDNPVTLKAHMVEVAKQSNIYIRDNHPTAAAEVLAGLDEVEE